MSIYPREYCNCIYFIFVTVGQIRVTQAEAETDERGGDSGATWWYRDFSLPSTVEYCMYAPITESRARVSILKLVIHS